MIKQGSNRNALNLYVSQANTALLPSSFQKIYSGLPIADFYDATLLFIAKGAFNLVLTVEEKVISELVCTTLLTSSSICQVYWDTSSRPPSSKEYDASLVQVFMYVNYEGF